ncbi:MAG TPA: hypothetical protein VF251_03105 [Pyrinomonadaceae bacterium]
MKGLHALLRPQPLRRNKLRLSFVIAISLVALSLQFHDPRSVQSQRQLPYSVECEDWVSSTQMSAGKVTRQEMGNFGSGWSRNAQLFWTPPPPVDKPTRNWPHLSHMFASPAEGNFEIILHYTAAPDFGIFRVFIDSQNKGDVDGYAPAVTPKSRSLGQFQLKAGNHQFLITVIGRAASAKNFFVGLDRLELRTISSGLDFGRVMDPVRNSGSGQGRRVDPPQRGGNPQIPAAQLFFATYSSSTQKFTVKAGTERNFNKLDLHQHFIWESPSYANDVNWRWQVALQPFSAIRASANLLAEDNVSSSGFTINFGSFPPLNAPQTMRRAVVNFYVRILPMRNGQTAGPPSNTVIAHYDPGSEIKPEERDYGNPERDKPIGPYKVDILSFTPAIFADPNRQGCVKLIKNPYYANIPAGPVVTMNKLAKYKPGDDKEYCPEHKSMSYQATSVWDYPGGWFKAYKIISDFYADVKNLAASEFAQTFCGVLKNPPKCKDNAKKLAGVAINVGLTAAGLPPTLPDLDDVAKGAVVDAAVNYSCMAVESQGGVCTPELRALFAKGYDKGLDQLIRENNKLAKEPFCESFNGALPCFSDYPGTKIEAAKGAVFQPPSVSVRVTLTNPSHSWAQSETKLKASLWLHNVVPAGTRIENYYSPIPETKLDGQLFVPVEAPVPFLAVGQSADVTLVFDRVQQYKFSTTKDDEGKPTGYTEHNGWCRLYEGGYGSLIVSFIPNSSGKETEQQIQLPKEWKCTFSP